MTTKLIIVNDACSNGDVVVETECGGSSQTTVLHPGQSGENWITTSHKVAIHETWPTEHPAPDASKHQQQVKNLITAELNKQDAMWGALNERADVSLGQLLQAALAQAIAVKVDNDRADPDVVDDYGSREAVFNDVMREVYPKDWSGFRDYGSDVANLVVSAAFLIQEIKRRISLGHDTTRTARRPNQPYNPATGLPNGHEPPLTINEDAHGSHH